MQWMSEVLKDDWQNHMSKLNHELISPGWVTVTQKYMHALSFIHVLLQSKYFSGFGL